MIGNDVVDLQLAARESNWRRKGFIDKVFSLQEQEIITGSQHKDIVVWLLWSMKEAAYKAHQRYKNHPPRLSWKIQQAELQEFSAVRASGIVYIEGEIYNTTSEITPLYVHTSATDCRDKDFKIAVLKASSTDVKSALIEIVAQHFDLDVKQLELQKDVHGMPFLTDHNAFQFNNFSLSSHGHYAAFVLSLINCETTVKPF